MTLAGRRRRMSSLRRTWFWLRVGSIATVDEAIKILQGSPSALSLEATISFLHKHADATQDAKTSQAASVLINTVIPDWWRTLQDDRRLPDRQLGSRQVCCRRQNRRLVQASQVAAAPTRDSRCPSAYMSCTSPRQRAPRHTSAGQKLSLRWLWAAKEGSRTLRRTRHVLRERRG